MMIDIIQGILNFSESLVQDFLSCFNEAFILILVVSLIYIAGLIRIGTLVCPLVIKQE